MRNEIEYSRKLEEAGLARNQAEAHIKVLGLVMEKAMKEDLATKKDFISFKNEIREDINGLHREFNDLRSEIYKFKTGFQGFKAEFYEFKAETKAEFTSLRSEINGIKDYLVTKMGLMFVASTTVITAILSVVIAVLKFAF